MNNKLSFYTNPQSRGQIVRWMLEEIGAEYETEIVEYGLPMKSPQYLAINPMGKVPAIMHGDDIVTEVAAICLYLADAFPSANLGPTKNQRADYYRWIFFAAGPVESAVTNKSLGFKTDDKQAAIVGYGNYELTMGVLDSLLDGRDYICGDQFTAADVYVGSQVDFGLLFGSIEATDNFTAYAERLRARSAYQKAKKIDTDLMA